MLRASADSDLVAAANLLRDRVPDAQFVVARAANLDGARFEILSSRLPKAVTVDADTDTVLGEVVGDDR